MIEGFFRFDVVEISIEGGESCSMRGIGAHVALRVPCGHVAAIIWVLRNAGGEMVGDVLWE